MDFARYRKEMLSIEASPEFAEKVIGEILQEGQSSASQKEGIRSGTPVVLMRKRSVLRGPLQVAACIAGALLLCTGIAAPLASVLDPEAAVARAPKNSMENIELSALTAGFSGDDYILDLVAELSLATGFEQDEEIEIYTDDENIKLIAIDADLKDARSFAFGESLQTTISADPLELILRLRVDPQIVDSQRLSGVDVNDLSYRDYIVAKRAVEALADVSLSVVSRRTGEVLRYRFDIGRFENQWDYEGQLRRGGPATISLERIDS